MLEVGLSQFPSLGSPPRQCSEFQRRPVDPQPAFSAPTDHLPESGLESPAAGRANTRRLRFKMQCEAQVSSTSLKDGKLIARDTTHRTWVASFEDALIHKDGTWSFRTYSYCVQPVSFDSASHTSKPQSSSWVSTSLLRQTEQKITNTDHFELNNRAQPFEVSYAARFSHRLILLWLTKSQTQRSMIRLTTSD